MFYLLNMDKVNKVNRANKKIMRHIIWKINNYNNNYNNNNNSSIQFNNYFTCKS